MDKKTLYETVTYEEIISNISAKTDNSFDVQIKKTSLDTEEVIIETKKNPGTEWSPTFLALEEKELIRIEAQSNSSSDSGRWQIIIAKTYRHNGIIKYFINDRDGYFSVSIEFWK